MAWTSLCDISELQEGRAKYVEIGGFQLSVCLDRGKVYVVDNECPHAAGNLSGGEIEDGCLVCPWHAWPFNLETGQLKGMPGCSISTYKVRMAPMRDKPDVVQADLPIF